MIHVAGEFNDDGTQRCDRCGYLLTDYRHVMVPEGSEPLCGWGVGAHIEVINGNPRYSGVTDDAPDCEPLQ